MTAARARLPRWAWPLLLVGALLVVVVLMRLFVLEPFRTPAGSMYPTLRNGDLFLVNKLTYRFRAPVRGDLVVFPFPNDPRKKFVKRVVAVAGDSVELRDGALFLNGNPVDQPAAGACEFEGRACRFVDETLDGATFRLARDLRGDGRSFPPLTVPPGQLYVLGDNRDNSHDSRYFGTISAAAVMGRALR